MPDQVVDFGSSGKCSAQVWHAKIALAAPTRTLHVSNTPIVYEAHVGSSRRKSQLLSTTFAFQKSMSSVWGFAKYSLLMLSRK